MCILVLRIERSWLKRTGVCYILKFEEDAIAFVFYGTDKGNNDTEIFRELFINSPPFSIFKIEIF